jgi:methyl-accepting chemotaxis protein
MLDRLSVNVLLKSVIATLAAAVVIMLSWGAWQSWSRLTTLSRISAVAETSAYLFTSLHNLRVDRSTTFRTLSGDEQVMSAPAQLKEVREAEMPALKAGLAALANTNFPGRQEAITSLDQSVNRLTALHQETLAAFQQPKAARRQGLAQEFDRDTTALMTLLDKTSSQMTRSVKLDDSYIDQLLEMKQLAWTARNAAGDASLMLSNGLGGLPLPADAFVKYTAHMSRLETAWAALQDVASGLALPPSLTAAIEKGSQEFLGAEYSALRLKVLKALIAGEKLDIKVVDWSRMSVAKLSSLLKVAEAALDSAKDYAAAERASASLKLWIQLGLLAVALVLAVSILVIVSRRVLTPLRLIQDVMLKVSTGDFGVAMPNLGRRDEVGQIASAVSSMIARIRETIGEIKASASEVTNASSEISSSTTDLSQRTEEQAASLEETTASMEVISTTVKKNAENAQQANRSAGETRTIAERGGQVVAQAVDAMAKIEESSRKISDIIGVIDEIARQTNLLALNAAVEAARAGEAGRGFAVVASEVRSLAQRSSQAAKDIKDLITNSNSQVKDGVDLVNKAGTSLNDIVESIKGVAKIVADIAAASSEQAEGLEQINKALTQMDEATQQNSALVEENAATAKTLETQAKVMDDKVAFFQIDAAESVAEAAPRRAVQKPKAAAGRGRAMASAAA